MTFANASPLLVLWPVFVTLMATASAVSAVDVVATVNGHPILVDEIDAPSRTKITRLREELRTVVTQTIDRLVDEHLRTLTPPAKVISPSPAPVTDNEIRAFRASRAEDFEGPFAPGGAARDPAVEHAAIRHHLERKALEAAKAEVRRYLREDHVIKFVVPDAKECEQALPPGREVAWVDGTSIRAAELEQAAALVLYRLRGEIDRERRRNIEAAIEALLLAQAAHRRGISKQVLLAEMTSGVTVTDAELQAFIESERAAGRPMPTAERARPYLEFRRAYARRQALLEQLRAAADINIMLRAPTVPRLPAVEGDAPVLGAQTGLRLIVYSNYRCTHCHAVHREIDRLLTVDPTVRVAFRDFIAVYDPVATEAARLSRCAARLGAFKRVRSELLTREPPAFGMTWYTEDTFLAFAGKLEIDPAAFTQCLSSAEIRAAIEQDTAHARELGFAEAPAFVAEGIPLSGMQSADSLARALHQGRESRAAQTTKQVTKGRQK